MRYTKEVRFRFFGNEDAGQEYIPLARTLLGQAIRIGELGGLQQNELRREFEGGVEIRARMRPWGMEIDIYVPSTQPVERERPANKLYVELRVRTRPETSDELCCNLFYLVSFDQTISRFALVGGPLQVPFISLNDTGENLPYTYRYMGVASGQVFTGKIYETAFGFDEGDPVDDYKYVFELKKDEELIKTWDSWLDIGSTDPPRNFTAGTVPTIGHFSISPLGIISQAGTAERESATEYKFSVAVEVTSLDGETVVVADSHREETVALRDPSEPGAVNCSTLDPIADARPDACPCISNRFLYASRIKVHQVGDFFYYKPLGIDVHSLSADGGALEFTYTGTYYHPLDFAHTALACTDEVIAFSEESTKSIFEGTDIRSFTADFSTSVDVKHIVHRVTGLALLGRNLVYAEERRMGVTNFVAGPAFHHEDVLVSRDIDTKEDFEVPVRDIADQVGIEYDDEFGVSAQNIFVDEFVR